MHVGDLLLLLSGVLFRNLISVFVFCKSLYPNPQINSCRGAAVDVNLKTSRATRKNNIRQRFVTLLKKFKVPDEEVGSPSI